MPEKFNERKVTLAQKITYILDQLNIVWTISGKTLQGASKNGRALPDDTGPFDIVLYHPIVVHSHVREDKIKLLKLFMNQINCLLQEPYESRILPSLGYLMEIYDPTYGKINAAMHYNVSCKLTLLVHDDSATLQLQSIPFDNPIATHDYLPLSLLEYEGCIYQAPNKPENYLKAIENYLNTKAKTKPKLNVLKPTPNGVSSD
jgi:hypothetical protein